MRGEVDSFGTQSKKSKGEGNSIGTGVRSGSGPGSMESRSTCAPSFSLGESHGDTSAGGGLLCAPSL